MGHKVRRGRRERGQGERERQKKRGRKSEKSWLGMLLLLGSISIGHRKYREYFQKHRANRNRSKSMSRKSSDSHCFW
jgi:hypothetical protein